MRSVNDKNAAKYYITVCEVEEKFKELKELKLGGVDSLIPRVLEDQACDITNPASKSF